MNSRQAISLIDSILAMVEDGRLSWEEKYDLIWKQAEPLKDWDGFESDWYDPDTSYEEDVLAYTSHLRRLRDKAERLKDYDTQPSEPTLNVTVRQALDSGRWSEFCDAVGLDPWRGSPSEGNDPNSTHQVPLSKARRIWGDDLGALMPLNACAN